MTKFYGPGDKSQAICDNCEDLVSTTFAYRSVPFDDSSGSVDNILVAVCDQCGTVLSVPPQSTPAIRRAREAATVSLEVNLRAPEIEILDTAAYEIDREATPRFRKPLITYYLNRLQAESDLLENTRRDFPIWAEQRKAIYARGDIPRRRLSFKVTPRTQALFSELTIKTGWQKTELVRSIVMLVGQDFIVQPNDKPLNYLRQVASLVNA